MKKLTKHETIIFVILFILIIMVIILIKDAHPPKLRTFKKVYPVKVELHGDEYFDCDSANLNYAWKDGVKIQLKGVYQIKFN